MTLSGGIAMPVSRPRLIAGALVGVLCAGLIGCGSQGSAGWPRVSAGGGGEGLSAGDPLGQALFAAHQHRQDRDQRLTRIFLDELMPSAGEAGTATATVPVD